MATVREIQIGAAEGVCARTELWIFLAGNDRPAAETTMLRCAIFSDVYGGEEVGDITRGRSRLKVSAVRKVVVTRLPPCGRPRFYVEISPM